MNERVRNFLKIINDPNLLEPRGKELIPGSVKFFDNVFDNMETFLKDETGKEFDLNNLPNIDSIKDTSRFMILALSIISAIPTESMAQVKIQEDKKIAWLLEAMDKIDPINYLANKIPDKKARPDKSAFTPSEKNILTWNLYHEARGENMSGILGVLLSTFERMHSGNYSSTAHGVVLQEYQYSWTLKIINEEERKVDIKKFVELRQLVENLTSGNSFEKNIKDLKDLILRETKLTNIPSNLTHYHLEGMLSNPKYSVSASETTKKRILEIEKRFKEGNKSIVKLGNHLFYHSK